MTVADLIRSALKTLGVLAADETPTASEEADAFTALNDMLDSWSTERLTVYTTLRTGGTLTPSLIYHTLGDGGNINTDRPTKIERASLINASGAEDPIELVSDAEFRALQGKTSTGKPRKLWIEQSHPLMRLHFNPLPDSAYTLALYVWHPVTRFDATTSDVDFPPGYARAIRFNLARELAPDYGRSLSAEAVTIADESKENLKRVNFRPAYLTSDPAVLRAGRMNITTGE